MTVNISVVEPNDAEAILTFYRKLVDERLPYIMNTPAPTLKQQEAFVLGFLERQEPFYIAKSGGEVVGMATGRATGPNSMEFSFSVRKDNRRQGLGRKLYHRVEQQAIEMGVDEIYAIVDQHNPSLPFYKALRFYSEPETQSFTSFTGLPLKAITFRKVL